MQMVMTPDETQIQISNLNPIGQCDMQKRVTRDNWKSPEYRVVAAIRKLRTDKLSRRKMLPTERLVKEKFIRYPHLLIDKSFVYFPADFDRSHSVYYQFFTVVLIRFQSLSLYHLNLIVLHVYPIVTSEDVC